MLIFYLIHTMLPIVLLIGLQRYPLPFQLRSISALLRDFSLEVYDYDPLLSYSIEVLANLMIFNIFIKSFQSCQLFLLHPLLHNSCCWIISVSLAASWFLSVRFSTFCICMVITLSQSCDIPGYHLDSNYKTTGIELSQNRLEYQRRKE